nr:hypothetical protein Iba_chr13dCG0010 [Ipomoea batatas]
MERDGPGRRREIIHGATPAFHSERLDGFGGDPLPRAGIVPVARERHGHLPRPENLHHLGEDPVEVIDGVVGAADALVAGVAEAVFGGDVDGGVTVAVNAVHGVAAGVEREVANGDGVRVYVTDPAIILAVQYGGRVVTCGEHVPRMRAHFRGHNRSFSITEISGQFLFQVKNLFLEARMGKRLSFGENKVATCISTLRQPQPDVPGQLDHRTDGFQQLGGPTRLDNDLGGVHKQTRLRQNIGVEKPVADGGDDGALHGVQHRLQGFKIEEAEAGHCGGRIVAGEVELQPLFESFEPGNGH